VELKVGKKYSTRNGYAVHITAKKGGPFPFIGSIETTEGRELQGEAWTKWGRHRGGKESTDLDIDLGEHRAESPRKDSRPTRRL
jgi:hypothetical protein